MANGYNPWIYEDLFESDIARFDGTKLASLDVVITNIESRNDIQELIDKFKVIKECFPEDKGKAKDEKS